MNETPREFSLKLARLTCALSLIEGKSTWVMACRAGSDCRVPSTSHQRNKCVSSSIHNYRPSHAAKSSSSSGSKKLSSTRWTAPPRAGLRFASTSAAYQPRYRPGLMYVLFFTRNVRDEPLLESDLLYLLGHVAGIHQQAVHLNQPCQRVPIQQTWQTPIQIQRPHA